jgi:hypothetical protein
LTVDDLNLYYGSTDPLLQQALAFDSGPVGGVVTLGANPSAPATVSFDTISVNGSSAYFSVIGGPIQFVPTNPVGAPYLPTSLANSPPLMTTFVVDNTNAYVGPNGLTQVPLNGGPVMLLTSPNEDVSLIVVDGLAVYYASIRTSGNATITRFFK